MIDLNPRLIPFDQRALLLGEPIQLDEISIVIPVKNQQNGVNNFLKSFFQTHSKSDFPLEIIIVDNNSTPPIVIQTAFLHNGIPIHLYQCERRGAAAARNMGVDKASGKWILFTDSDCIATNSFVSGYLKSYTGCVAYSGRILSLGKSLLDRYYDSQEVLIPPKAMYGKLTGIPMYIVTANAIVYRDTYVRIGGFNEAYPAAGGEDEDFSMRLWQCGNIDFEPSSHILHDYQGGIWGFVKRFINYGRGAYITGKVWNRQKRPKFFGPKVCTLANIILATFQYILMLFGYWKEKVMGRV